MNFLNTFTHYQIILKFSLGKGASGPSYWVEISTNFLGNSRHAKNSVYKALWQGLFSFPSRVLSLYNIDISQLHNGVYGLFGHCFLPNYTWGIPEGVCSNIW